MLASAIGFGTDAMRQASAIAAHMECAKRGRLLRQSMARYGGSRRRASDDALEKRLPGLTSRDALPTAPAVEGPTLESLRMRH
jgi:hypothetical protein